MKHILLSKFIKSNGKKIDEMASAKITNRIIIVQEIKIDEQLNLLNQREDHILHTHAYSSFECIADKATILVYIFWPTI